MFALKEFNLDHPLVLFILNSSPAVHIARNFKEEHRHQRAFFVKIGNISSPGSGCDGQGLYFSLFSSTNCGCTPLNLRVPKILSSFWEAGKVIHSLTFSQESLTAWQEPSIYLFNPISTSSSLRGGDWGF